MGVVRAARTGWLTLVALVTLVAACGDGPTGGSDAATPSPDFAMTATKLDMAVELACGGPNALPCPMGMFCELRLGQCVGDQTGICRTIPKDCPATMSEVCGCDDTTYLNDCFRQKASVSASQPGKCP